MLRTPSLLIVAALTFTPILQRAISQPAQQAATPAPADIAKGIDPIAVALLNEVDAKYKSMKSFSCEVEDGFIGKDGKLESFRRALVEFRRPYCLAITTTITAAITTTPASESSKAITDGNRTYIAFGGTTWHYTELPYSAGHSPPFDIPTGLFPQLGVFWIGSLLTDYGSNPIDLRATAISVSSKREGSIGRQPLEIVTARRVATSSDDWDLCTFTIGVKDHLLYQQTARSGTYGTIRAVQYYHPRFNPRLNDAVFNIPRGSTPLPLIHVVTTSADTVTLHKGSLDGLSVGDELRVYVDANLASSNAGLVITELRAHECMALELFSSGLHAGEVCVKVKYRPDLARDFDLKK